jgi:hypothetical protein
MYHPADFKLDARHEQALVEPFADDPAVIETFNLWLYDGEQNIGFNLHPRLTGGEMDASVMVFLPDGRILRANMGSPGRFADPMRPASAYVKLNCEAPFERWSCAVDKAPVYLTSDEEQAARTVADETPTAAVSLQASYRKAAPAWINGALLPESRQTLQDQVSWWFANRLSSGFSPEAFRYDQLVEGEGTITFEGRTIAFRGVGLRGHVRGVRRMPGMVGHTWAEGYFPKTRRGFGVTMFLREGGGYEHSEGFIYDHERLFPARIISLPHIDRDPARTSLVYELACDELGLVRITGADVRAFWWQMPGWGVHAPLRYGWNPDTPVLMKQSIARFEWDDGDLGYGLNERSG